MSTEQATCPKRVYAGWTSGGSNVCGKTFKTDEQREAKLCGIHLAAKKRREANDARRNSEWAARDEEWKRSREAVGALESVGVAASAQRDGVLLTAKVAREVVARLLEADRA